MLDAGWAVIWSVLWKGSIILALAGAAAALLRQATAALRHAMWVAAVAVVALLALSAALPPTTASEMAADSLVFRIASGPQLAPVKEMEGAPLGLAVWMSVSALLLFRLGLAHRAAHRAAATARRIGTLPDGVAVLEGAPANMPVCWGFLRPVIILPPEASRWSEAVRESVLKHEMSHIARGDCWWQLFARVAASLLWFQPLLWWAVWRIAEESEHASDDAVLREGAAAADYAGHLISVARCLRTSSAAALAVVRPSRLESRLKALLAGHARRGRLGRAPAFALLLAACALLLPLAAARGMGERAYKISDGVTSPSVIHKVEPTHTEEARDAKIEGTVVLSIEVDKQGIARNIKVIRGLGYGLTENAVNAVKQWRFKPGMKEGKPVRVRASIEINFRLK